MTYIFCDIQGTYDVLNHEDKIELIKLINEIDNKVLFSFVSTANIDYVKNYYEDFKKYTKDSNIILKAQIGQYEYINEKNEIKKNPCEISKGIKMLYFQESEELAGEIINNVIYIDDNPNMFPLIYTMDKNINKRIKNKELSFTLIEKNNQGYNYCFDSMELEEVVFINQENKKFIINGIKDYLNK